ncbi:MAG: GAF domain-containing protein [Bacteroidales bacterium]|nr:GAF domain-containing protein [Bacteroidales bacterium]
MHQIVISSEDKAEKYRQLIPQVEALIGEESNQVANYANVAAALKECFGFFWVGFYFVDSPEELVLGPFQGPVACTRIGYGKGVCGTSWKQKETIVVEDVEKFPGHIACSSLSRSEIVVPLMDKDGDVVGVLDIDSDKTATFDSVDKKFLEILVSRICKNAN